MIPTLASPRGRNVFLPILGMVIITGTVVGLKTFNIFPHRTCVVTCGTEMMDEPEWRKNWLRMMGRARVSAETKYWADAEKFTREALSLANGQPDSKPDYAYTQAYLGYVLVEEGRLTDAEPYQRNALSEYLSFYGSQDPIVADARLNLADNLYDQGKLGASRSLYMDAIPFLERDENRNRHDVAGACRKLAEVELSEEHMTEARQLALRSVETLTEINHEDFCSDLALSHEMLAFILTECGDYKTALKEYDLSLPQMGNSSGLIRGLCHKTRLYLRTGKYKEALETITAAKTAYDSGNYAKRKEIVYINLYRARVLAKLGHLDQANALALETLRMRETEKLLSFSTLAEIGYAKHDYESAYRYEISCLEGILKDGFTNSSGLAQEEFTLAKIEEKRGNIAKASEGRKYALEMMISCLGADHPRSREMRASNDKYFAKLARKHRS